jgi:N-acetylmuramoyl-L-alanine amidase
MAFAAVAVEGVRVWRAPERTRLVLDLSENVQHKLFQLDKPARLVLDLRDTRLRTKLSRVDLKGGPIKELRSGVRGGVDLRIVLDLKERVKPRSFTLPANEHYGNRLVLDLYDLDSKAQTPAVAKKVAPPKTDSKRDIVIAIDPGHGGEDPGALGRGKTREKHVVLAVGRKLKKLIDREPGFKAVMVRDGDYFIPLEKRPKIALKNKADLFLSIHADGFKEAGPSGASVFRLSRRGESSTFAAALAARENRADIVGGLKLPPKPDKDVDYVLLDLAMESMRESSARVGKRVLSEMGKVTKMHKKRVEPANFSVLRTPDLPGLLIETGFMTTPAEERRLKTGEFQQKLARAIFKGVKAYFYDVPPDGSYVAWAKSRQVTPQVHVASRGETLSGIAARYNVSMTSIKRFNKLNSNMIRIGQRIKIPAS